MSKHTKRNNPAKNAWLTHQPIIGTKLYKLAVEIARNTPKHGMIYYSHVQEQVRNCKGRKRSINGNKDLHSATQCVITCAHAIVERRQTRHSYRIFHLQRWYNPKLVDRQHEVNYYRRYDIAPWEKGTLREKQERRAKALFHSNFYLRGNRASAGRTFHLAITDNPDDVTFNSRSEKRWGRRYAKTHVEQSAVIPRQWYSRVIKNELHTLSTYGTLVLDAEYLYDYDRDDKRIRLYRATYATQGVGYNATLHRGFIARSDGDFATSEKSANYALRGLIRRLTPKDEGAYLDRELARYTERYGGYHVYRSHAYRFKYCGNGVTRWCNDVGINPYDGATLARVNDAYYAIPCEEALRVIRYAARLAMREAKALATA